ncbi:centrosomal protein of 85 kDa [Bufo bufo]|uniref:centrosomal protein of 85 kDa n=1 Tax=Bufo bufo TaxID=8384 RepID=UPI001ABE4B20|nr:centrosomal protein of 85 kDa [Bufo bufo]
MAALDRYKDSGFQQPARTVRSSSYTEWQTPQVLAKPPSRISGSHGAKEGASLPNGTSASEHVDDFCNASGSTSFQPIRSQVAIPTAHVVPSTMALSSSNIRIYDTAGLSTESVVPSCPFVPSADPSTVEDTRKFEMPNIEPTMNQSALLNTLCTDGRTDFSSAVIRDVEPYRALPESKEVRGAEVTHGARYQSSHLQSQGWRADSYSTQPSAEYSSWKLQQQYGENLRTRMEKLQLMRDYSTAPMYSAGLNPIPNEWERVVKASDNILLEKEVMLERQRQHIAALEQKVREGEVKVHNTLLSQSSPYSDMCMMRIQDLQREVTFLRAQFSEKSDSTSREKAELEKKLCAMEAESRGFREAMKELAQKHSEEMKKQDERVKGRERHINSLKKKCQKETEQNKEKQQRIETLERYMADLPTAQDHQKQVLQMKELQEQNCLLQETVSDLEKKLRESRGNCKESEALLADQKFKEQEYLATIERLQREIKKFEMADWKKEEKHLIEEADKLQQEVAALHKEQDCLQKVIENHKKRMEQMCSKIKGLEEQVGQEEATGQALKEESQQKEAALQQLKAAVKDLATQNQDLMESNVTMQEQLRLASLKSQPLDVQAGQLFTLYKEMNRCQKDLRSICCLLSQRVEGVDPNLSMLLGVHSTTGLHEQEEDVELFSVERYLNGIDKLKKDIEELRTTISDCYAQDMGDNCITQ